MHELDKIVIHNLCFHFLRQTILKDLSLRIVHNSVTALIGPSGSGKTTFLMTLNRLWESIPGASLQGKIEIEFNGRLQDIYSKACSVIELRRAVGMVFQHPNPLPMSIFKNIAFPLKLIGEKNKQVIAGKVELALRQAHLWEEVVDRLGDDARRLSGGQQQRLCIARALILGPEVLLLDEPTSSLDSRSAGVIEDLMIDLSARRTLIIVSHYMNQVERVSNRILKFDGLGGIVNSD